MKVDRRAVKACCGKTSLLLILNKPIDKSIITHFKSIGYKELEHFTKAGILYIENDHLIATGPIGSNKLQIKCRTNNCQSEVDNFIRNLEQL